MHTAMPFSAHDYPYPSKRNLVYGKRGMVATSQPLAAQIGLDILKQGGNAVDAAVATAAALTVVEPTSCDIAGDAFAIVWIKDKIYGLNASGPAPMGISRDALIAAGHDRMPERGWVPVTVPGCPAGWLALNKRFGKLPFADLLAPAIDLAREGFPVSPTVALQWQNEAKVLEQHLSEADFANWLACFSLDGDIPEAGQIFQNPEQANSLEALAVTECQSLYGGPLGQHICDAAKAAGGYLRLEDLTAFKPEWVEPVSINYKGYDIWELPPNGIGLVALEALNIIRDFDLPTRDSVDSFHTAIEAMKLAYSDGKAFITDSTAMKRSIDGILSDDYAATRRALIGDQARLPEAGDPPHSDTIYLAAADEEGNMVSFIQSNYESFGSGIVVPGTGMALQNRGANFSLDPGHDNVLAPGKRTAHTIIPGFISKDGQALGPLGVMGGYMQPQGHMQMVMNMVDWGLNPQAALDAPRWQWISDMEIQLEHSVPRHIAQGLEAKGHKIVIRHEATRFGRGQIMLRDPETGVYCAGVEPRCDSVAASW